VMNSFSKYIGGHGNALGGSITDTGVYEWKNYPNINENVMQTAEQKRWALVQIRKRGLRDGGGSLSPEAAHTLAIGAETLALRMKAICANALTLANYLTQHPKIKKVNYPGLATHPQYAIATELFAAGSGLMSFELTDGVDCLAFLNKLKLVIKSSHLGDNRTLAIPIAHTIFFELGPEKRKEMGISESLIRLSIGIEDIEDLMNDFKEALS
jgi:O-acetylhomoserine (thiol)-lyase